MFKITPAQWKKLDTLNALDFVDDLLATMLESNPQCFAGLPRYVCRTMILNGITSAEGFGLYYRSSLATFISLQCHASPNFLLHGEVDAILQSGLPEQDRVDAILDLPEQTWAEIRTSADSGAWFEPRLPEQLARRTAARVCGYFQDITNNNTEKEIFIFFESAVARAADHGIDWDEGIAVFAAALSLYGPNLDRPGGPQWANRVFLPTPLSNAKIVNMLRNRVALDTDRII